MPFHFHVKKQQFFVVVSLTIKVYSGTSLFSRRRRRNAPSNDKSIHAMHELFAHSLVVATHLCCLFIFRFIVFFYRKYIVYGVLRKLTNKKLFGMISAFNFVFFLPGHFFRAVSLNVACIVYHHPSSHL